MSKYKMLRQILMILLLCVNQQVLAKDFFNQRYRGWLWFEEGEKQKINEEIQQELEKVKKQEQERAMARREVEEFAKDLEDLKYMMIRYPDNLDHVHAYKQKEAQMMKNALKLDHSYRLVNFLYPDEVDHKANPVNLYGRKIKEKLDEKEQEAKIRELASNIELFFVFSVHCPYSEQVAPVISNFAKKYQIEVEGLSNDGSSSQYFKTHYNPQLIELLKVQATPTVILVTKDGKTRFELARGAVSASELEEKMLIAADILEKRKRQHR